MTIQVRCKPGDLALVVMASVTDNVGQIVEVLSAVAAVPALNHPGPQWQVRCAGGHRGLHYHYADGRVVAYSEGPVPDVCLVPLRGDPRCKDAPPQQQASA